MRYDFSQVDMSQLGFLFPITLTPHSLYWKQAYENEKNNLIGLIGKENITRMSHIGSTAIEGLLAKPTIDILLEVASGYNWVRDKEKMLERGYVVNNPPADLVMFIKGYTPTGFQGQTFHIHIRESGDWGELYFRDYLQKYRTAAAEYEKLKKTLQTKYTNDRDAYTEAKSSFVEQYTALARQEFGSRYLP